MSKRFWIGSGSNYDVDFTTPQEKRAYRGCFFLFILLVAIALTVFYFLNRAGY